MDPRERFHDYEELHRLSFEGMQQKLWTGMPGTIVSCNGLTCVVQPALKREVLNPDGSTSMLTLPPISEVPVQFPSGGGVTLTFPVKKGDECWLSFGSRSIDGWFQLGGAQLPPQARMHNLSDAVAHLGFRSSPRALSGVSSANAQLRNDSNDTHVEIDPQGNVNIIAKTAMTITAPVVLITGELRVTEAVTAGWGGADQVGLQTHHHTQGPDAHGDLEAVVQSPLAGT